MLNPPAGEDFCGTSSKETRRRSGVATLIGTIDQHQQSSGETEEELEYMGYFNDF